MIDRYTRPEMGRIWDLENKFRKWLDIEIAAAEAMAELGEIPAEAADNIRAKANFDVNRISDNYFDQDNIYSFNYLFTVIYLFSQVGRNSLAFEQFEKVGGNLVIQYTFVDNRTFFLTVKSGCIILVLYPVQIRVAGFKHFFGFAFVKLFQFLNVHFYHPPYPKL